MPNFDNPEIRAKAAAKSIETRRKKAETRRLESAVRQRLSAPAARVAAPRMVEVEEAMTRAASSLPPLDSLFEVPEARRADALDMKLASMKTTSGLKGLGGKDTFVRRRAVSSDVTDDRRAYGSESRPKQMAGLAVDSNEPGRIIVYDRDWVARSIPEQNFKAVLATGDLTFVCTGCGGEHLREVIDRGEVVAVEVDFAVDACPAKDKAMKIRCPVCAKRGLNMVIADTKPQSMVGASFQDDESFVDLGEAMDETPRQRLTRLLHEHMAWVHQSEAPAYGVDVVKIKQATLLGAGVPVA